MIVDTYGKDGMKTSSIYEWYNVFSNDPSRNVADRLRSGRPCTTSAKTDVVREKIHKSPQEHFRSSSDKWIRRWEKCVSYNGEYFEYVTRFNIRNIKFINKLPRSTSPDFAIVTVDFAPF